MRSGTETITESLKRQDVTRTCTDKAIEFIEHHQDTPFFFYLAHPLPHTPLAASSEFKGTSQAGLYGDVIEEIDYHTGRLLKKVKELGLDNNTYIIFTSDNGPWLFKGKQAGKAHPLRSGKTSTYDGGLRVPCIIRAPGKVPAGTTCDLVTATIDLMPTIVKLAGGMTPQDRTIDGLDLSQVLLGHQHTLDRHFYFYQHRSLRAVRKGQWKLHLPHSDLDKTNEGSLWRSHVPKGDRGFITEYTLYNLDDDIGETVNVASGHSEVVRELRQLLGYAQQDIGSHNMIGDNSRQTPTKDH